MKKLLLILVLLIGSACFGAYSQSKAIKAGYRAIKGINNSLTMLNGLSPLTGQIRDHSQLVNFHNHRQDSLLNQMKAHTDSLISLIREPLGVSSKTMKPLLAPNGLLNAVEASQANLSSVEGDDSVAILLPSLPTEIIIIDDSADEQSQND